MIHILYSSLSGYVGVVILAISIFLVFPLFTASYTSHITLQLFFLLILLSITYTIKNSKVAVLIALGIIIPYVFFDTLSILHDSISLLVIAYYFNSLCLLITMVFLSQRILSSKVINTNIIFATIALYFIAGIFMSKIYFIQNATITNAFKGLDPLDANVHNLIDAYKSQFDFLYYSFSILTTLGMGDISPLHHFARSTTVLEAIFGQLFVATFIAKVVSSWRRDPPC